MFICSWNLITDYERKELLYADHDDPFMSLFSKEKFDEMDKWSDYGDEEQEDWGNPHDPYDMAGTEMKPEALPLEPIIEENSVIKDSPE